MYRVLFLNFSYTACVAEIVQLEVGSFDSIHSGHVWLYRGMHLVKDTIV